MRISYKSVGFGFALLSLIAITWQHYGMTRVLHIDRSWPHFKAVDDRPLGGGTEARLIVSEEGVLLTCDLTLDYEHAFCEIAIDMDADGLSGIDMRVYDTMVIAADYSHPGVDRMRVMIRNFNPAYSKAEAYESLKVNEIDFRPSQHPVLEVPLSHFQVASWWRRITPLSVEHNAPEFSHVTQLNVGTGGAVVPGRYSILLKYLEFRGKWIDAVTLYRGLLIGWLIFALLALLWELHQYRQRLKASQQRETELKSMNRSLKLQNERFEKLASRDALTGVYNRAGIRDLFLDHVHNARMRQTPLAAIFIDIDHFKIINDTHGHQLGDQVLTEFAQLLASRVREDDLFARWGGEEFLLLCPDTTLDAAHHFAEQLRRLVASQHWCHDITMSASFGVTEFNNEDVAHFIDRADTALYKAKAEGRNRVVTLTAESRERLRYAV